ncbi:aromatic ring-hydroxylating dioxygenase subunit alpha [Nocardioides sp.]|uniref:aromatic ring-hydroxylating dioxygenase subunit alpha n=1 Tax=Nocardioides sp. TaxID=35761 RepID=UPI003D0BDBC5
MSRRCRDVPHNAWYVVAGVEEVGRTPLARRALGQRIALYRTTTGQVVALEDRCAHKPVPLSAGNVVGDDLVAAYTGFRYAPDGTCTRVPTQDNVPYGARVRAFPVHEDGHFVWVWAGDPRLAALRRPPTTPWLEDPAWVSFGETWETAASLRLMQENFADITHVPLVDPEIAPPALTAGTPPPLDVRVSETTMSFSRSYPASPVASWHAQLLGLPEDARHVQREEGEFHSPGLWVDRWVVTVESEGEHTFVFTHALTPLDEGSTRHSWQVSRNFATSPAATGTARALMRRYYLTVRSTLETMQAMLDEDGPRAEVALASDAAATQVSRIMDRLVAEETGIR